MKFSSKVKKCGLSPMRKFHPYAVAAEAAGKKIYHLNIGQPDIETPPQYFEAIREFHQAVLEYAPSPGIPVLIKAIQKYYDNLNMHFEESEILITTGGSEALQITHPHLSRGRVSLCGPGQDRGGDQRAYPGDHVHQPRQPHRFRSYAGGDAPDGGYCQGA